jgi:hypothetical protein
MSWLSKNNLSVNFSNYNNIISLGNDYIKRKTQESIQDIELELLLNDINSKLNVNSTDNLGIQELAFGSFMGVGLAAGLCVMFPIAIVPTLVIGGLLGLVGGKGLSRRGGAANRRTPSFLSRFRALTPLFSPPALNLC